MKDLLCQLSVHSKYWHISYVSSFYNLRACHGTVTMDLVLAPVICNDNIMLFRHCVHNRYLCLVVVAELLWRRLILSCCLHAVHCLHYRMKQPYMCNDLRWTRQFTRETEVTQDSLYICICSLLNHAFLSVAQVYTASNKRMMGG